MKRPVGNGRAARMVATLACLGLLGLGATSCSDKVAEPEPPPKSSAPPEPQIPDPPELVIEDLKVGEGDREAKEGDELKVNYVGRLLRTNAKFDSNDNKKDPFKFKVGEGVIEGWSKGVVGMKKGGKRKLTIPSRLAYGPKGQKPKIPADAPLLFEIELIGFADEKNAEGDAKAEGGDAKAEEKKDDKKTAGEPKKEEKKDAATTPASSAKKEEPKK